MQESDVIVVNGIDPESYDRIINEAVRYAILSIPFTINRMQIGDLLRKIINIAKGKVAEGLFMRFCHLNGIRLEIDGCSTPFYQADKRDFVIYHREWDIKNNFLYHRGAVAPHHPYIALPALVPNRGDWDQWGKRDKLYQLDLKGSGFIFTFLKNGDHYQRGKNFFELSLSDKQLDIIQTLYRKYGGQHQVRAPFSAENFWQRFEQVGSLKIKLHHRPWLVITACAVAKHWSLFVDSGPGRRYYPDGYTTLTTTINNRVCTIGRLPAFADLFPYLRERIIAATFKSQHNRT